MTNNRVYLHGTITTNPVYSHDVYGEGFFEMKLAVERLSGLSDVLPITISERLIEAHTIKLGSTLAVNGQFRSYNKMIDGKSKLMLTVFVRDVLAMDELDGGVGAIKKSTNVINLVGYICKPPIFRVTPFDREIADLLLAVNRAYNKSDYIPCIAWGRNARFVERLSVGARVEIEGRIQSREYQKKLSETELETKVAYEISISKITDSKTEDIAHGVFLNE